MKIIGLLLIFCSSVSWAGVEPEFGENNGYEMASNYCYGMEWNTEKDKCMDAIVNGSFNDKAVRACYDPLDSGTQFSDNDVTKCFKLIKDKNFMDEIVKAIYPGKPLYLYQMNNALEAAAEKKFDPRAIEVCEHAKGKGFENGDMSACIKLIAGKNFLYTNQLDKCKEYSVAYYEVKPCVQKIVDDGHYTDDWTVAKTAELIDFSSKSLIIGGLQKAMDHFGDFDFDKAQEQVSRMLNYLEAQ